MADHVGLTSQESDVEDDEETGTTSTGSWKPQLHFVWSTILDQYFSNKTAPAVTGQAPFQDFFRIVVDGTPSVTSPELTSESLFANSSSPERRYWGFSIVLQSLPLLPNELIPQIFTPNFMRCWINNLSSSDRYLHKAALQIAHALQEVVKSNPTVGFTLLSQLVGKHGRPDFDKITKTKVVEGIMGSLTVEGVKEYVAYLQGNILGQEERNGSVRFFRGVSFDGRKTEADDQLRHGGTTRAAQLGTRPASSALPERLGSKGRQLDWYCAGVPIRSRILYSSKGGQEKRDHHREPTRHERGVTRIVLTTASSTQCQSLLSPRSLLRSAVRDFSRVLLRSPQQLRLRKVGYYPPAIQSIVDR